MWADKPYSRRSANPTSDPTRHSMQRFEQYTIILGLLNLVAPVPALAAAGETPVILSRVGDAEFNTDNRIERKPLSVDLALDVAANTAQFSGMWGCLADFAESTPTQMSDACLRNLPVIVSERDVSFTKAATGDRYATQTSFFLSRYTGALTIRSLAVALPAAKAQWTNFIVSAALSCAPQTKKF